MSAAGKRHLSRVHDIPCVLCGSMPVEAHHIRDGQGMSQRATDWMAVALCADCHRGPLGIHGDRTMMRIHKVSELDLVAKTLEALYG
jgi:hypothetical protein